MTEYVGYPWVRQAWDTNRSYEVFRDYLHMGPENRSLRAVANMAGNSAISVIENWSSQHKWAERVAAYDAHMDTAATDGMANQIASVREKHIELADKLLDHLSHRLDVYIQRDHDPSIRWIQAFATAAKVQAGAFALRDTDRTSEMVEQALELIKRFESTENA